MAKTRSALRWTTGCRWTCGCLKRTASALRCFTSRVRKSTTWRCAAARTTWAHAERIRAGDAEGRETSGGQTEEEIYAKLKLDYIPPELRENTGEIAAAENHKLPQLIERNDMKGDLQMHTTASDGKNSIEEMAEAARQLGHQYIAITDHSKSVTVANGLDERRMAAHIKKIHAPNAKGLGIRVLAGSEVDILKDGSLDYSDEILAQLDVVVCSIHSYMQLDRAAMTDRMLAVHRESLHPDHCASDRAAAAGARFLRLRHGEGAGRLRQAWRGHGVQFLSRPAGFEGRLPADVQGARRESGHLDGLAQHAASAVYPLRSDDGAARLAGKANVINTLPVDQFLARPTPEAGCSA